MKTKVKYPVTLIFIDEPGNFKKKAKPLIAVSLFQDIQNFSTYEELKLFLEKQDPDLMILLFVHVFRNVNYKGVKRKDIAEIERFYKNLPIYFVTSDKAIETGEAINKPYDTFTYYEIPDLIDKNKLLPKRVSEIEDQNIDSDTNSQFIFISHSSKDKEIVTSFFENLLRLGMDIPRKNIFYSSHPSTGITTGGDIPDELKEALKKMTIFIQYLSSDYKKSEVCLNEMGAAWLKLEKKNIITLKAPNLKFKDLGFLNVQRIGIRINNKDDLLKIAEDYKNLFDFNTVDFNNKVDKFLKENNLL